MTWILSQNYIDSMIDQADVVITDSVNYSVALCYDEEQADAPFVVAKSNNEFFTHKIKKRVKRNRTLILDIPDLARAVGYRTMVLQEIPVSLYYPIRDVLIYTRKLRDFKEKRSPTQPEPLDNLEVPDLRYKLMTEKRGIL